MKKLILQFAAILLVFFSSWFVINKVDWMTLFNVQQISHSTEKKLGNLYWEMFKNTNKVIEDDAIVLPLDSILNQLCISNYINKGDIKLHIIESTEVNAFALPNKHLVVYSGLLKFCENESELSGVISHELAHIQKNHVMKKLVKEVSLSVLISMAGGNSGGETIRQTAKLISSSAYDRKLEKEADIKAVEYLTNANLNPEGLSDFLQRIANKEPDELKYLGWMNSHPDTKERVDYILQQNKHKKGRIKSVLAESTWENMKELVKN